jgi:hypothetical protein
MKKIVVAILVCVFVVAACSSNDEKKPSTKTTTTSTTSTTKPKTEADFVKAHLLQKSDVPKDYVEVQKPEQSDIVNAESSNACPDADELKRPNDPSEDYSNAFQLNDDFMTSRLQVYGDAKAVEENLTNQIYKLQRCGNYETTYKDGTKVKMTPGDVGGLYDNVDQTVAVTSKYTLDNGAQYVSCDVAIQIDKYILYIGSNKCENTLNIGQKVVNRLHDDVAS